MLGVYFQEKGNGKYMADLIGLNRALLIRAGLSAENIDADPPCTCCNDDIFFSHRASGGKRGTQLSVITLD
jgi:copper oxidase (laccase) domain-containing protein